MLLLPNPILLAPYDCLARPGLASMFFGCETQLHLMSVEDIQVEWIRNLSQLSVKILMRAAYLTENVQCLHITQQGLDFLSSQL